MKLSDLQSKDIVSITDGKKIGTIIDAEIDENGMTKKLIVQKNKFFNLPNNNYFEIKWNQIKTIGKDVILVNLSL